MASLGFLKTQHCTQIFAHNYFSVEWVHSLHKMTEGICEMTAQNPFPPLCNRPPLSFWRTSWLWPRVLAFQWHELILHLGQTAPVIQASLLQRWVYDPRQSNQAQTKLAAGFLFEWLKPDMDFVLLELTLEKCDWVCWKILLLEMNPKRI